MTTRVPPLRTAVGRAVDGDNLLRGRSVKDEIAGRFTLTGLLVFSVSGRELPALELAIIDDYCSAFCACDVRLWPMKLARVVAAFGGAAAGLAAGQLTFTSTHMGTTILASCARLLLELADALGERSTEAQAVHGEMARRLEAYEALPGFGVPFRAADERVIAFRSCLARRGLLGRPWFQLAAEMERGSLAAGGPPANSALYGGATFLEVGVRPEEMGILSLALMQHVFTGVVHEGATQDEPQLRRLPAGCVHYRGPPPRRSPRAGAGENSDDEPAGDGAGG